MTTPLPQDLTAALVRLLRVQSAFTTGTGADTVFDAYADYEPGRFPADLRLLLTSHAELQARAETLQGAVNYLVTAARSDGHHAVIRLDEHEWADLRARAALPQPKDQSHG